MLRNLEININKVYGRRQEETENVLQISKKGKRKEDVRRKENSADLRKKVKMKRERN